MKFKFCVLFLLAGITAYSQDTLRIMQYNLLMFGNNFSSCNQSNNSYVTKTSYLKTIVNYVRPDILLVNEINESTLYHDYILTHALNVDGINYWERGNPPNYSNSDIVNEIYFNSNKLSMTSNVAVETNVRDIDIFKMKFFTTGQPGQVDLNCVVAHLKAGNETSDENERANETNKLMNYLHNASASGNYTMSGDFNLYTASEQAFQNLLFYSDENIRFYDPISKVGAWNNNSYYADCHTQSTHTSGDCFSTGGLDDRFDFILVSDEIMNASTNMKYITGSYRAVGQDGEHFNSSINSSPQNNSVPTDVLNALYNMSDHLPVVLEMLVGEDLGTESFVSENLSLSFQNPVQNQLELHISFKEPMPLYADIINLQGKILFSASYNLIEPGSIIIIPMDKLVSGIYLLKIYNDNNFIIKRKIVKH